MAGISFSPKEIAENIQQYVPDFKMAYADSDPRQAIADSWPRSINDSEARADWGWHHKYDLDAMTKDMLENLQEADTK